MKDYYYILGVDVKSSNEQIKSAYRKLSKKFHPDTNNGDKFFEERFKEIREAYEILGNRDKKITYDYNFKQTKSSKWAGEPKVELMLNENVYLVNENIEIGWKSENCQSIELNLFGKVEHQGSKVIQLKEPNNNYKIEITGISGDFVCKKEKIISVISRDRIKIPEQKKESESIWTFIKRWNNPIGILTIVSYITFTLFLLFSRGDDITAGKFQVVNCITLLFGLFGLVNRKNIWLVAIILQVGVFIGFLCISLGDFEVIITYNVIVILLFYLLYKNSDH